MCNPSRCVSFSPSVGKAMSDVCEIVDDVPEVMFPPVPPAGQAIQPGIQQTVRDAAFGVGPAAYLAKLRAINDANTKAAQTQAERDAAQRVEDDATLFVKSSDYSVVESNNAFTKFRWQATIVNSAPRRRVFDLIAKFVDAAGATIVTRVVPTEIVNAQSETEVKGEAQIEAAKARTVARLTVVAARKGM